MNAIEIHHLKKFYGKARGIVDVSFDVAEGEVFGFIGPNGAGKSTTIRTLLGLIKKTSGGGTIFGMDCEKDKVKILAEVGYLPGEVFYYDKMRAIDRLADLDLLGPQVVAEPVLSPAGGVGGPAVLLVGMVE